jgi:methyl-accepting chemotaxis protein
MNAFLTPPFLMAGMSAYEPDKLSPPTKDALAMPNPPPEIRRSLALSIAVPVLFLSLIAGLLVFLVNRLMTSAEWVDHTDRVIATANDVQKRILDEETALRGFLLTSDRRFLEPYEAAHVDDALGALEALVSDSAEQSGRIRALRLQHGQWLAEVQGTMHDADVDSAKTMDAMLKRKTMMDGIRGSMATVLLEEDRLRVERAEATKETARTTKVAALLVLLLFALTTLVVTRRHLNKVVGTFDAALDAEKEARASAEALVTEVAAQAKEVEAQLLEMRNERDRALSTSSP